MSQLTLWDIKKKQTAKVVGLDPKLVSSVKERLTEMGFASGQNIQCLRRSPFKGPIVLQLGDCVYSLEQDIADRINISMN